jgi:MFS transporter, DHA2 family, multidrug resistance protein
MTDAHALNQGHDQPVVVTVPEAGPQLQKPTDGLPQPQRTIAIMCVLGAMALAVLDAAAVNVALPTISRSFDVPPAMSVLVVTAYQTALVMALLPCAALSERFGYRRTFTAGVLLFVGGSALCVLSPSLQALVAARVIQGFGASAIMALGIALIRFVVPERQLGAAIGWNALTVALCAAAGPTFGAIILSASSWPWIFAINLPLGAGILIATRKLPVVAPTSQKVDLASVGLNAATFASLVVAAEFLPKQPLLACVLFVISGAAFLALVGREKPKLAPMFPFDLLRVHQFRIAVIASICCFAGQGAGMIALPFYLQHGLGLTPIMSGAFITPWPLAVALAAPTTSRLAEHIAPAWLCALGGLVLAIGLMAAALFPLHQNPGPIVAITFVCGLGFGLFQVPNNRNMFLAAPRARSAAAGGMQATARLCGQIIGSVIVALLLTVAPLEVAPNLGLGIGAVLALLAGIVSLQGNNPSSKIPTNHTF